MIILFRIDYVILHLLSCCLPSTVPQAHRHNKIFNNNHNNIFHLFALYKKKGIRARTRHTRIRIVSHCPWLNKKATQKRLVCLNIIRGLFDK